MADLALLVLRYAHILSAILWVGAMGFSVMVLRRVIPQLGMPARKELMQKLIPVVIRFNPSSAVLTIVFGVLLYALMGTFDPNVLWGDTWGQILLVSLVLTVALFSFGVGVIIRASRKLLGHLNEAACSHQAEVGRLQKTFNGGQVVALVWGFVILALMIIATEGL